MDSKRYLLDTVSTNLAKLCFLYKKDVEEIQNVFNALTEEKDQTIYKSQFLQWIKLQSPLLIQVLSCYEYIMWNDFFQIIILFCASPSELIIKHLLQNCGTAVDLQRIKMHDIEELVKLTCGNEKAMECWSNYVIELIPNATGFYTSDQIILFLAKHKHFIQDLYLLQRHLCDITLGKEKWKVIKLRRIEQFKQWKNETKEHQNQQQQQQQQSSSATIYPLGKTSPNVSPTHLAEDENNNKTKERRSFFSFFTGLFRREKKKKEFSDYKIENEEYQEILDAVLHFFFLRYHPINTDDIPAEAPRIKELKKIGSTYTIPGVRLERPSLDTLNLVDEDFCMVDPIPEAERNRVVSKSNERVSYNSCIKSPLGKLRSSPLRKEIRSIQPREIALSGRSEQFAGSAKSKRGIEVNINVPGVVIDA